MYAKRTYCNQRCFGLDERQPLEKRFWAKVKKTKTHWLWMGVVGSDGYGHMHVSMEGQHAVGAHRVAWFLNTGRWPKDDVLHKPSCNTKLCVRFSHLYLGDDFDNAADRRTVGSLWHPKGSANPNAVLTRRQATAIKRALDRGVPARHLAYEYGIGRSTVYRIRSGQRYLC